MRGTGLVLMLVVACATSRHSLDEPSGFPSADHAWSSSDFRRAATEADRLSGTDAAALPRRGDPVFARISDMTVGEDALDPSRPLDVRLELTATYMQSIHRVMKAYARSGPSFTAEVHELSVAAFANGCDMLRLLATVDAMPDRQLRDPNTAHQGYAMTRTGVEQMAAGVLDLLHPREGIPDADRARYAGLVAGHLPPVLPLLPAGDRQQIRGQLDALIARERDRAVRQSLEAIP
jgi:hypothetical protein